MTIFLKNPNETENSIRDFELIRSLACQLLTRIGKSISNLRNKQLTSRIRRERIIGEESGHLDNINELNFNRRSWGAEIYSNGIPSGAVENRFVHSSRVYVRYQVGRRNNIVTHYYDLLWHSFPLSLSSTAWRYIIDSMIERLLSSPPLDLLLAIRFDHLYSSVRIFAIIIARIVVTRLVRLNWPSGGIIGNN